MAWGDVTYQSTTRKEDLLDFIADVSPDDNPLSTLFGTTTASQTNHEWTEDYLSRPTTVNTAVEGSDATFSDLTNPSRRNNIVQTIRTTYQVSDDLRVADVAGMSDMLDYQAAKATRDWKNNLEYAILRAAIASGNSGSARQMAGIQATVTS